jgi:hypothetical protein
MKDHLSAEDIDRFRKRAMTADEQLKADDHFSICESCRNLIYDDDSFAKAFKSLKEYIESSEPSDSEESE